MSYVKPLAMAAALALSLTGMEALAATHTADITPPTQTHQKLGPATFYVADAGTPNAHKVYSFKQLDRNHNGQLSRGEIPKDMWRLRAYFPEADWDNNGQISPAEYIMWKTNTVPEYAGVYRIPTHVYFRH